LAGEAVALVVRLIDVAGASPNDRQNPEQAQQMTVQMNASVTTAAPKPGDQMQQGTTQPKPQPQQGGTQPGKFSDWAML
jgi:hypothetical protein